MLSGLGVTRPPAPVKRSVVLCDRHDGAAEHNNSSLFDVASDEMAGGLLRGLLIRCRAHSPWLFAFAVLFLSSIAHRMLGMAAVDEAWQHCAHGLREVLHGRASRLVRLFSTA